MKENILQRFWHTQRFRNIKTLIEPTGGRILDIGCADGLFTNVIRETAHADEIIGVDVLPDSVQWAANHWKYPAMRFQVADAHSLSFEDDSFDAVFILEALEHIIHPEKVLHEVRRVLKREGYAVFLVPTDNLLFRAIWAVWTKFRGKIWDDTHIQSFQKKSLGRLAQECGLRIEKEETFLLGMLYMVKVSNATKQKAGQPQSPVEKREPAVLAS